MEELEITQGTGGLDRRSFIQKSALVGGMVWAAPLVSSFGSPAFAGTLIIINGKEGDPNANSISNVAFVLRNGSDKCKHEEGSGFEPNPGPTPCVSQMEDDDDYGSLYTEWQDIPSSGCFNSAVTYQTSGTTIVTAIICPPDDQYVAWAIVKIGGGVAAGNDCLLFVNPSVQKGACLQVSNATGEATKTF